VPTRFWRATENWLRRTNKISCPLRRPIASSMSAKAIEWRRFPVIQAIPAQGLRSMQRNGNTRAQLIYLEYIMSFEADRSAAGAELLKTAVEYKEKWASIFAECDRRDIDRPDPLPHPDDVVIDYKTGEVRFNGPVLTEQKDARDLALQMREDFERGLEICVKAMEADPNNLDLRRIHGELTKIVDWFEKRSAFFWVSLRGRLRCSTGWSRRRVSRLIFR